MYYAANAYKNLNQHELALEYYTNNMKIWTFKEWYDIILQLIKC